MSRKQPNLLPLKETCPLQCVSSPNHEGSVPQTKENFKIRVLLPSWLGEGKHCANEISSSHWFETFLPNLTVEVQFLIQINFCRIMYIVETDFWVKCFCHFLEILLFEPIYSDPDQMTFSTDIPVQTGFSNLSLIH